MAPSQPIPPDSPGGSAIASERERQRAKGWTDGHDASEHPDGRALVMAALVKAAAAYRLEVRVFHTMDALAKPRDPWPWEDRPDHHHQQPEQLLTEAGALLAAALDVRGVEPEAR